MRGETDTIAVSDELYERLDESPSLEAAYVYFVRWVLPDMSYLNQDEQADVAMALFDKVLRKGGSTYDPDANPALVLLLSLAILDRHQPSLGWEQPKIGPGWIGHEDRVPSVEIMRELGLSPRQLAAVMREVGIEAQTKRFGDRGVTRGYLREHIRAAWDERFAPTIRRRSC